MVGIIRDQWWVLEPSNTTILAAMAAVWLGSQILLELIGWCQTQVIIVEGE